MKPLKILLFNLLLLTTGTLSAQISISSDSIKNVLCQKWGFKAILMGGQRLSNMNESVTYEFVADGTFKRVSSNGKSENGTWTYNSEPKFILLKIKKSLLHISSLTSDELIVSPGGNIETEDSLGIGTILKPITNN